MAGSVVRHVTFKGFWSFLMIRQWAYKAAGILLLLAIAVVLHGCAAAEIIDRAIPKSVDAQYKGLAGQKVAVMIWADRALRIDYPSLTIDTANATQSCLIAKTDQAELKDTQFPWEARSVARFQKEHPEIEGRPVTEYAQRISGITRLVSIEVAEFSTHSDMAVQLLKGNMTGNVKVIEIENGKAKIAYERSGITVAYPPKAPAGVSTMPESGIYAGTVQAFGLEVAQLFYGHVIEED